MFVISINGTRKKLRLLAKIFVVLLMLFLVGYAFSAALPASTTEPIISTDAPAAEGNEVHYPGEPIRVYNSLEDYFQNKVAGVADSN